MSTSDDARKQIEDQFARGQITADLRNTLLNLQDQIDQQVNDPIRDHVSDAQTDQINNLEGRIGSLEERVTAIEAPLAEVADRVSSEVSQHEESRRDG